MLKTISPAILPKDYFKPIKINTDKNNYRRMVYTTLHPSSNYLWQFVIYFKTK